MPTASSFLAWSYVPPVPPPGECGLPPSGRHWYLKLRTWMKAHGAKPSSADQCVFIGDGFIIGVYVDDMLIAYDDTRHTDKSLHSKFDTFMKELSEDFKVTIDETAGDMLGVQIEQNDDFILDFITLHHENYIENMRKTYLDGERPEKHQTPASKDIKDLVDTACNATPHNDAKLKKMYQSLVGALLYSSITVRPDISYAVGMLSRCTNNPSKALLNEAKRCLHYLVHTKTLGLRYVKGCDDMLWGQCDADWHVHRSTSGFAFFMAGATISYLSKKQPTIAMSSTEAEIMAASQAALEAVFLRTLIEDLRGKELKDPIMIGIDNKGAVDMALDYRSGPRTKHIARRHLKIRELVAEAVVAVKRVATADNIADIFTKPLEKKQFEALRDKLLNMPHDD